jgi:TPR repeat protein
MWDDLPEGERFPRPVVRLSPRLYANTLANNPERGAHFVRAQALRGSAEAQLGFGHMLLDGYGVIRDPGAALRWFRLAARQGNLDAINMVGRCHELGWGTTSNMPLAVHWYGMAAAKGHPWAEFNLAALIVRHADKPAALARALSLLVSAARKGNPKAMNMIGHFREKGWMGRAKPRAAAFWFRRAAQGGCFRGQFHYARFVLREGQIAEARRWLRSSLRNAPADFVRDATRILLRHPDEQVRSIGLEAAASRNIVV